MSDKAVETPELVQVAAGLYVRQEIDNCTWIDLGGSAVVVDALEHRCKGGMVIGAIRDTLGDTPVEHVLNTHTHPDHVALNADFQEQFGADIINARTSDIPDEGLTFEGERRSVRMIPMGGCHTPEDCIVEVMPDRVLLSGDLFGWGMIPVVGPLRSAKAELLERIYERMIDFDAGAVIPGHGPLATTDHLRRWPAYFRNLVRQVADACAAGRKDAEILSDLGPPDDMQDWWRLAEWKHDRNVRIVLQAVRKGRLGV